MYVCQKHFTFFSSSFVELEGCLQIEKVFIFEVTTKCQNTIAVLDYKLLEQEEINHTVMVKVRGTVK
jgi:hypothetical protein